MIEPAHGHIQMLSQADGSVGRKREACDCKAIDARLRDFCRREQFGDGAAEKPVRAFRRIAHVRDRHRRRQHNVLIGRRQRHQAEPPR
jgi:hypothetical protein